MKLLRLLVLLFCAAVAVCAQTLPQHWPPATNVKVYLLSGAFTGAEQSRIGAAIEAWRPLLPAGVAMQLAGETNYEEYCDGCITFKHEPPINGADCLGECEWHETKDATYVFIRIDPVKAGSEKAFQLVVEHELGHALGLDHRDGSIMQPIVVAGHGFLRQYAPAPSEKDAAILRALYARPVAAEMIAVVSYPVVGPLVDITQIAQDEAANNEALKQHSFTRRVLIQTLDLNTGEVTGTYDRLSRLVLLDSGERAEKVIYKHSNLKGLRITKQDRLDFSDAQMGLIGDFAAYRFTKSPTGIRVTPLAVDGRRVFVGEIQLNDKGGITRLEGTTLPEGSERFPHFVSTRKEVDGYLFPSETIGEGVLHFPNRDVRVRWQLRFSDYRRFRSQVSITEASQ